MTIVRYTNEKAEEWNAFVAKSKNGTFLFDRNYMDYHSDRFTDHSLMFYDNKNRLISVLPANEKGSTLCSHGGLTYGGFVLSEKCTVEIVLSLFDITKQYLADIGFTEFIYKQIPSCYHLCPAEEDEYALWRNGAVMSVCNISATVTLNGNAIIPMERRRRRGIARAQENGYEIKKVAEPDDFWPIMLANMKEKYNAMPVHSLSEMKLLMSHFPDNIHCYLALKDGKAEAGAVIYITKQTIHVQYAHASSTGKEDGAIDFLYNELIERFRKDGYKYFDIGTSNEDGGKILNENLIAQKEGFGGRGIAYKQFTLDIYNFCSHQHSHHEGFCNSSNI